MYHRDSHWTDLIFGTFIKISTENPNLIAMEQKYKTLYVKCVLLFPVTLYPHNCTFQTLVTQKRKGHVQEEVMRVCPSVTPHVSSSGLNDIATVIGILF